MSPNNENTKRKEIKLMDQGDRSVVVVKLWNDFTDIHIHFGETIKFWNVRSSVFHGFISVSSTDETDIEA